MQGGIARHNGTCVRPVPLVSDQSSPNRIRQYIETRRGEGVAAALVLAQDVIVRLMLPLPLLSQCRSKLPPQKPHRVELVRLAAQAHPHEMQVIGHEAIRGTKEPLAHCGMEQQLTEVRVKSRA